MVTGEDRRGEGRKGWECRKMHGTIKTVRKHLRKLGFALKYSIAKGRVQINLYIVGV